MSWDEFRDAASWPSWAERDEPGYDFRDGAWRQLAYFRDLYLARGFDVVVDAPATDFASRDHIFNSKHPHINYLVVLDVGRFSHRRFLAKRLGNGSDLGRALYYVTQRDWDDPGRGSYLSLASQPAYVIRFRNRWPTGMAGIKRGLRRYFGRASL